MAQSRHELRNGKIETQADLLLSIHPSGV